LVCIKFHFAFTILIYFIDHCWLNCLIYYIFRAVVSLRLYIGRRLLFAVDNKRFAYLLTSPTPFIGFTFTGSLCMVDLESVGTLAEVRTLTVDAVHKGTSAVVGALRTLVHISTSRTHKQHSL
jgi:hypothetical protein